MRNLLFLSLLVLSLIALISADCTVSDLNKLDCGFMGIDKAGCEAKSCCWTAGGSSDIPWCFFPAGHTDDCSNLFFTATSPGFTASDISAMTALFYANLNIEGKGGVVAAPDTATPGGNYYYAWARDAALSMKSYMFLNDFDLTKIQSNMDSYIQWVLRVQGESDPNGIDIRVEPKFNLPNGDPYTGGWCRPQTDAPGLRVITLSLYADVLTKAGKTDTIKRYLWTGSSSTYKGGAVKNDLDWLVGNWKQNGCDLWEEVQSDDFFWGRMNFRKAFLRGAALATQMGDNASAAIYKQAAADVEAALASHWTGSYIEEASNRKLDGAVISAFNEAFNDDEYFKPTDAQVAQTITALNTLFCHQFNINQKDTTAGIPGVLYGRYGGDIYAGGNPWILLSADLAKLFYRGAIAITEARDTGKTILDDADYGYWEKAMNMASGSLSTGFITTKDINLASAMLSAGDAVMTRIYSHVKNDGGHLAEQLDRETGVQKSAKDLSWSYACTLVAMKLREKAANQVQKFQVA